MTVSEAIATLAPLIGSGGLTAIIVAALARRNAAQSTGPTPDAARTTAIALGCAVSDKGQVETIVNAITGLCLLVSRFIELEEAKIKREMEAEDRELRDELRDEIREVRRMKELLEADVIRKGGTLPHKRT